jgi:hypothetical protein
LLGADLPKNLMVHYDSNPTGHWESNDLHVIHDRLLASAGSSWHDWRAFNPDWFASSAARPFVDEILVVLRKDFTGSRLFAIKDPRICRFWPLWRDVLAEFGAKPIIVMPVRNPLEVAASLKQRDGFVPATSHLLWLRHVLDAEHATRGLPRAVTLYQSLLEDWQQALTAMTPQLRLNWPRRGAIVDLEIEQYLSAKFKHHSVTPEHLAGRAELVDWVRETYRALAQMAERPNDTAAMARLDRIRTAFDKASAAFGVALAMNEAELAKRDADVQRLSTDLSALREAAAQREREQQGAAAALSSELTVTRAAVADREQELAEQARRAVELGEQLSAVGQKFEELSRERDRLAAALEAEKAGSARAGGQLVSAQAALRERDGDVGRLTHDLEAARLYLRDSQAEVQRLAGELDGARTEVAHAAAERQNLSESLATAFGERDRLAAALEEEKVALAQANEQAAALGREAEVLRDVIREYEATATEFLADLEAMQALAQEREREREQFATALEQARQAVEWRGERLTDLSHELRAAEAQAERAGHLETALATVQQDNDRREQLVIELSQKLEAESGEKARLAGEYQQALAAVAVQDARMRELATRLEGESSERSRLAGEHHRALEAGAAQAARMRELQTRLEAESSERWRLERSTAELERAQAAALAQKESEAQARIAVLRSELVDAEAAVAKNRRERGLPAWKRLMSAAKQRRLGRLLIRSGLFDAQWYTRKYPEAANNGRAPIDHYLDEGYLLGFRPNPLFDSRWYLERYEDVRRAGVNPLVHYLQNGYREGRDPGPGFQTEYYLEANPDVRDGMNPLAHYLRYGRHEGRLPLRPE